MFCAQLKENAEFWWRLAKATHSEATAAGMDGDSESRKNLAFAGENTDTHLFYLLERELNFASNDCIFVAVSYAEKGLKLNEESGNAHKWFAITLGSKGDFLPINDKIKNGFTFKEHVDRAVEINPQDPALHHLLGRFCYEVSYYLKSLRIWEISSIFSFKMMITLLPK